MELNKEKETFPSKSSPVKMDFDDITRELGQFGKYQRRMFFLICLVGFPFAFNNMCIVFIAAVPDHWCASPGIQNLNLTQDMMKNATLPLVEKDGEMTYSSCERFSYSTEYSHWQSSDVILTVANERTNHSTEECPHGWQYDDNIYVTTIVTQWDLVCGDKWFRAISSSVYMAGLMAGVLIIGNVSDLVGRRPAYIVCLLGSIIFAIVTSFSPNYIAFCCLRFITGFFTASLFTTGFVMVMELVGPDYRQHAGIIIQYFWAVGYMSYAIVAYFIRDWFTLNLVASCILLVLLPLIFVIPESPRWLYLHGKSKQANVILQRAAKVNKKTIPDNLEVTVKVTKKGFVWDLCRTPRMACRSMNIYFNWFVNSAVYYGLSLNTSNLGGDEYINFVIAGAVEIPAYILCQLALHYGGRKWPLCVSMVLAGAALLFILAVPSHLNWLSITLAMIGKFFIAASFAIIYTYTAELYPTAVRNVGMGTGSFFARIGGVVAPYIGQLSDFGKFIPYVVFGVLSVVAGLLALAFPETHGRDLPETLEDGENFGRKNYKKTKLHAPNVPETRPDDGEDNPAFSTYL